MPSSFKWYHWDMHSYLVLIRGINVGGKSTVPMAELKQRLEELGFTDIATYLQTGNVVLRSKLSQEETAKKIEAMMAKAFRLESVSNKVLVITPAQLQQIVDGKPDDFGVNASEYYDDVIFLMDIDAGDAFKVFTPREGVDKVWQGVGVIYSQRLGALRTKSRLNRVMSSPLYKSMTIRTWGTTVKLQTLLATLDTQ